MKRVFILKRILLSSALFLIIAQLFLYTFSPDMIIHRFFSNYGYRLEKNPIERVIYTFPQTMNKTLENYNSLQKEIGLDITPYLGKTVVRYTYIVTNFPFPTPTPVRANVLMYKNKIIAADIMTVGLEGFMISPAEKFQCADN
ncbi:MAG: DUF4830 domain-containing protein [Bacillota bacterium]|nr:DUF4830 domain-containing protein [Bacillota bacterium]